MPCRVVPPSAVVPLYLIYASTMDFETWLGLMNLPDVSDLGAKNPLSAAVFSGDVNLLLMLLDQGCDPNTYDMHGLSPLQYATIQNKALFVDILLRHGADPQFKKGKDATPALGIAADKGYVECMKLLLDAGAAIDGKALILSSCNGYYECMSLLIKAGADVNYTEPKTNCTSLHVASAKGYTKCVKLLVENGADINAMDGVGNTALHFAVFGGFEELTKMLLNKGLDADIVDLDGNTAFHKACESGHLGCAKRLFTHANITVDMRNKFGSTPLMVAALHGHLNVIKWLVENKADINGCDNKGWSVLRCAAVKTHFECVRFLLDNDAFL